jgi:hypothetical protein
MTIRNLLGIWLACTTMGSVLMPALAADTLLASDFRLESWAKTVDYFDYARAYALLHGIDTSGFSSWHANTYMTYVNTSGLHMLYAGLINVTFPGENTLTVPMQTILMHYRTANNSRDVLLASNYLMLLAFNDTAQSLYPGSPDMNDQLWSSFSLGFDFGSHFAGERFPALQSKTEIIPLAHSDDKLHWSWGMKYKDLAAIWWRTFISPTNHTYNSWPVALTTYDELTFTYDLAISPETNKATLTESHIIGRMTNLWIFGWLIIPWCFHYNSTGCYVGNLKLSNETVYDYLQKQQIRMSIVNFQTTVMADRETRSKANNGQNVTDNEVEVSKSSISTYSDDNEKILDTSFGTKETYKLFNYTKNQNETDFNTYDTITRTTKIAGFAHNNLFTYHMRFMKFLPYLVGNMHQPLFQKAQACIANMTRTNCLYIISYPTFSGYRVEHDPITTVYLATATTTTQTHPFFLGMLVVIGVAGTLVVLVLVIVLTRRKKPSQASIR